MEFVRYTGLKSVPVPTGDGESELWLPGVVRELRINSDNVVLINALRARGELHPAPSPVERSIPAPVAVAAPVPKPATIAGFARVTTPAPQAPPARSAGQIPVEKTKIECVKPVAVSAPAPDRVSIVPTIEPVRVEMKAEIVVESKIEESVPEPPADVAAVKVEPSKVDDVQPIPESGSPAPPRTSRVRRRVF